MLKIENLCVVAEGKNILKDFNLCIKSGEIHVLMGPNGAGKSTVCKSIMRHPTYQIIEGSIFYNEENITHKTTGEIARAGIYYVAQTPIEIEGITNAEMLRTAMSECGKKMDIFAFQKKSAEVCEKLSMPKSFLHRYVNSGMSGGERKKNELLHMWMLEPKCILLDEIDSGLDVDALKIVGENLKAYQKQTNASMLIVTHHQNLIDMLEPDFVHILQDGRIVESGTMKLAQKIEKYGFSRANSVKESENCE